MTAGMVAVERRDPAVQAVADHLARDVRHAIRREPEVLEDRAGGRRGAEMVEADDGALVADPALPAERHPDLDADPLSHVRRQHAVPVRLVLRIEALPAGQRDNPCRDPVGLDRLGRVEGELELRAQCRSG
jgi:hypothetical protein